MQVFFIYITNQYKYMKDNKIYMIRNLFLADRSFLEAPIN